MYVTLKDEKLTQAAWYLIHCKPEREFYTAHALKYIMHLETFVPQYTASHVSPSRTVPFFPGYIFVHVDLHVVAVSEISACPGVVCLVRFGGEPLQVDMAVLDELAEKLKTFKEPGCLKPGDIVRMKQGPLQDLAMVFVETVDEGRRVSVLLEFLGGSREVRVDSAALETKQGGEMSMESEKRQTRSTRGRGRRIMSGRRIYVCS